PSARKENLRAVGRELRRLNVFPVEILLELESVGGACLLRLLLLLLLLLLRDQRSRGDKRAERRDGDTGAIHVCLVCGEHSDSGVRKGGGEGLCADSDGTPFGAGAVRVGAVRVGAVRVGAVRAGAVAAGAL